MIMKRGLLLFLFGVYLCYSIVSCEVNPVTFGSIVVLQHVNTKHRLYSDRISWDESSGAYIATAIPHNEYEGNCLWMIKPRHEAVTRKGPPILYSIEENKNKNKNTKSYAAGASILCGEIVRLEHAETEKNLYASSAKSHLTSSVFQVGCRGNKGIGTTDDDFIVECLKKGAKMWNIGDVIAFRHSNLKRYLVTSTSWRFTKSNCPGCPITDHLEPALDTSTHGGSHKWKAFATMTIQRYDDNETNDKIKDEL